MKWFCLIVMVLCIACSADPSTDDGVTDPPSGDTGQPAQACTCSKDCPAGLRCLQSEFGGPPPFPCEVTTGIAECRPTCDADSEGDSGCPSDRPNCIVVLLSSGCCSDEIEHVDVCCANEDATDNTDCL